MKNFVKLTMSLLAIILIITSLEVTKPKASSFFKDIDARHKAYEEILFLAQGKMVNGDKNGYFNPKNKVTRAEFSALLGRALNLDGTKRKTSFKDVGASNFASGYIQSAVKKNIISGYKNGTFKPDGYVTRGEMAIMTCRAFGYEYKNTTASAAQVILAKGIDTNVEDGTFGLNRSALREETAIYIARAMDYRLRLKSNESFNGEGVVNASSLNVRKGPSTVYSVATSVKNNETVLIGYDVGDWKLIKTKKNIVGFVYSEYVSAGSATQPPSNGGNSGNTGGTISSETLVIDPGHGGKDPGVVGFGLKEKDVVLDTGLRLKKLLIKTPFGVKYTRETDVYIAPEKRPGIAKSLKGTTFVSIHANGFNGSANGTETFYWGKSATNPHVNDSKLLAESIQKRMLDAMGTKDRGVKHGNYVVLRENTMPSTLVELAFIDQKEDNNKLKSPQYRQKAAEAIYLGILDYYQAKGYNVSAYYKYV
ncbi:MULTISPECIES: N-acetylmuramoyl-L-alanine amidase [Bacillus]|uniref:N-acetylmuramoyl-L-alanine amidase n=1 Tax=Bacillus TaxID=1386 RepID=UPI0002DE61BD|nr:MULTISPECIES: N-acetylmuramoyl-L-alanine amidase [Bacillus]